MNNDELQNLTETISKQYFNKIFEHEAYFNQQTKNDRWQIYFEKP